jgi:MFS family permease/quinol monooxygenase YgiN
LIAAFEIVDGFFKRRRAMPMGLTLRVSGQRLHVIQSLVAKLGTSLRSSPLRKPTFRLFYFGSVAAALGYTMQATISSWLMATLTPSALMVALVQTASTAPTLFFGLIGGALSDIVERRKVILVTQLMMLITVAILAAGALVGIIGPVSLLMLTFLVGCGFTFYIPAQQASINEFVSRAELPGAVALGAVAFNVARAVGPALAGAIAAWLSPGSALLASALFFTVMIAAVRRWKHRTHSLPGVPERLLAGVRSGLRYARHSTAMRALIVRNLSFSICASAFWALLPVIARDLLGLGAGGFGLLSAGIRCRRHRRRLVDPHQLKRSPLNNIVTYGVLAWTMAVGLIAVTSITALAVVGACGAGAAWVCVLAGLSAGTQSSAPAWVRARAVAMNLVATQASLAVGSALWGLLASSAGIRTALATSAVAMLTLYAVLRQVRVHMGTEADVLPHLQVPDLAIAVEPLPDDGPVLIQIEYRIDPEHRKAFIRAIEAVGPTRRRSGAMSWRVFRDLEDEERFVERYVIASWADYLRQRARTTMADSELQKNASQFQRAGIPIRISRLIGADSHDAFLDAGPASPAWTRRTAGAFAARDAAGMCGSARGRTRSQRMAKR